MLTRFRRFCEAYRVEYALEGVVEGFDTIDYVDPERLTRGLFVRSEERTRFVLNEPKRKPPVKIGDKVVVVGKDRWHGEESVLPAVLLVLEEHHAFFFEALEMKNLGRPILLPLSSVILVSLWGILIRSLPNGPLETLGSLIILVLMTSIVLIEGYILRPRLYQCDEQTWHALIAEVAEKFGIKMSV